MSVSQGDFYYYWIVPVNATRVPGTKSTPIPSDFLVPGDTPWFPESAGGQSTDPILPPGMLYFDYGQDVDTTADNLQTPYFGVSGSTPVNAFPTLTTRPFLQYGLGQAAGGSLNNGSVVWVGITAVASDGTSSPISNLVKVNVPGTAGSATGQITLSVPCWPTGTAATGYRIYAAYDDPRMLTGQVTVTVTPLPNTITYGSLGGLGDQPPSPYYTGLVARAKRGVHLGVYGGQITGFGSNANGTGWLMFGDLVDSTDNWVGRIIQVIGLQNPANGVIFDFKITAFANTTGTFTVTPDPVPACPLTDGTKTGQWDVAVILTQSTAALCSATTIGDTLLINFLYPGGSSNDETGLAVRILYGTGAGQQRQVTSNTATQYTVNPPWDTVPDATSVFVVVVPAWEYSSDVITYSCAQTGSPTVIKIPIINLANQQWLLGVFGEAQIGSTPYESDPLISPVRLAFGFGNPSPLPNENSRTIETDGTNPYNATVMADDQVVYVNCIASDGITTTNVTLTLPPSSTVTHTINIIKISGEDPPMTVSFVADATDTLPTPAPTLTVQYSYWMWMPVVVPRRHRPMPRRFS
jgi:hypothetical protein